MANSNTLTSTIPLHGHDVGYVHSIYSGGMVDGLGIRTVVFLSGCPLRCRYCHNPDSWKKSNGEVKTVDEVIAEVLRYKNYYNSSGGGVTISGGEPFSQPEFLLQILKASQEHGMHTALDTSGYTTKENAEKILPYTNQLLLDIKAFTPATYKDVTGVDIDNTLNTLAIAQKMQVPTWVRYVLVPGLTDNLDEIKALAHFLQGYDTVKKIEVLPFHKHGEYKWENADMPYALHDTQPPTDQQVDEVREIFGMPPT